MRPYPIEYKRGQLKKHRADEVQLCAQAICLEDMFGQSVPEGALFYMKTRRRLVVVFDEDLRALTARVAEEAREMIVANRTPPPIHTPACKRCSLADTCCPDRLQRPAETARWLAAQIGD